MDGNVRKGIFVYKEKSDQYILQNLQHLLSYKIILIKLEKVYTYVDLQVLLTLLHQSLAIYDWIEFFDVDL